MLSCQVSTLPPKVGIFYDVKTAGVSSCRPHLRLAYLRGTHQRKLVQAVLKASTANWEADQIDPAFAFFIADGGPSDPPASERTNSQIAWPADLAPADPTRPHPTRPDWTNGAREANLAPRLRFCKPWLTKAKNHCRRRSTLCMSCIPKNPSRTG